MTETYQILFDVLRASLWGTEGPQEIPQKVREELKAQAVEELTANTYLAQGPLKYLQTAQFVRMSKAQTEAVKMIQNESIPIVVLKGTAVGLYYPAPHLRAYGDIDLLVLPEYYEETVALMEANGYIKDGTIGESHTGLYKDGFYFEVHQSPPGMLEVNEGEYMYDFLLSGFKNIQTGVIDKPLCIFPMLPWQQNGLELIWHFRVHLHNGIGLRHVIDWMMFAHTYLDDKGFCEYQDVLSKSGLLMLAKTVTRMCQIYLGLEESITWCSDISDDLCLDLMEYIIAQGNFGQKRQDDKAAKVLTKYRTPLAFIVGMQHRGLYSWNAAKQHPLLRPFAWAYVLIQGLGRYLNKGGIKKIQNDYVENRERRALFDQLYGSVINEKENCHNTKSDNQNRLRFNKAYLKTKARILINSIRNTPFRPLFYYLQDSFYICRHVLFGKPKISATDRNNVEANVTFIYKSFNRQRLAKRLYRCIKAYYPAAKVVIADDSNVPLSIDKMEEGDKILHLPFNCGLGAGLAAALEEVQTPFVMRLDDDLLLTPQTKVHEQLSFLCEHNEVDLIAVQMGHRKPGKHAERYRRIRMNKRLIIPAGTIIGGCEVVYKAPNVFVARTSSLRRIGYDPNIRMIDHHEFFFRAAGQIVCVQNPEAFVMHCHNLFEKNEYNKYRSETENDATYIFKKHGKDYL